MAKRTVKKRAPRAKKEAGRPQFFSDPKKWGEFIGYIRIGCSRADACRRVGCARKTIDNAMERQPELRQDVEKAETEAKVLAIGCVTQHSQKNPVIALQYLGRKWPNEWAYRKPDVITRPQFKSLIDQLIATLINLVPAEHHQAIYNGVSELLLGVMAGDATNEEETQPEATPEVA